MVYSNGAYCLTNSDGDTLMMPINGKLLKKYYAWSWIDFSFVTLFMIKLTLHLWSKLHLDHSDGLGFSIQDAWRQIKASSFNESHHDRLVLNRLNVTDIMLYDVNIEEMKKLETSILASSLFSRSS